MANTVKEIRDMIEGLSDDMVVEFNFLDEPDELPVEITSFDSDSGTLEVLLEEY